MNNRIVILGAGPTGLGAGHRLAELGHPNWQIFEKEGRVGGLAASVTDNQGFIWDQGGHVMFSHYPYFDDVVERTLGTDFDTHQREAWVWLDGRFVPYPFQNNIHRLPKDAFLESVAGVLEARRHGADPGNFAEHIDSTFGQGIARHFMVPYNSKVWAHPLESLGVGWLGERVAGVDVRRVVENLLADEDDVAWGPNNTFRFPLKGTGMLYELVAASLPSPVALNQPATGVDVKEKVVTFEDGRQVSYDALISTLPIPELVRLISDPSQRVVAALSGLKHTSGYFVGVGIDAPSPSSKCWIYFPEPEVPFYRVTYLSNYSDHMTPGPDQFSLLAEVSASEHRPVDPEMVVQQTVDGLIHADLLTEEQARNRIISRHLMHAEYSYPVPTLSRDESLAVIQPWLESHHIYSRGRFGAWKYEIGNTDHSFMMGVEIVDRLVDGKEERTWAGEQR